MRTQSLYRLVIYVFELFIAGAPEVDLRDRIQVLVGLPVTARIIFGPFGHDRPEALYSLKISRFSVLGFVFRH